MDLNRITDLPIFIEPPPIVEVTRVDARDYAQIAKGKVDHEFLTFVLQTVQREWAAAAYVEMSGMTIWEPRKNRPRMDATQRGTRTRTGGPSCDRRAPHKRSSATLSLPSPSPRGYPGEGLPGGERIGVTGGGDERIQAADSFG